MKKLFLPLLASLLYLSGCSLTTKHKLPIPIAPSVVQKASAAELVAKINDRWGQFDSLHFVVDIKLNIIDNKAAESKEYPLVRGHIFMRKPEKLRIFAQVPIIETRAFDLSSDGQNFTIYIPSQGKAIKDKDNVHLNSNSVLENLRARSVFDAMIVRGLDPNDLYAVTADTVTVEDSTRKHLYQTPEYILSVMRASTKPDDHELEPVRVLYIHREDLLPYEQDFYDTNGNLERQVTYSNYKKMGTKVYPSTIVMKQFMQDHIFQVILTVDNVIDNVPLTDDQFQIKMRPDTKIETLEEAIAASNAAKSAESSKPK